MCGRFSLPVGDRDIAFWWDVELGHIPWKERYNVAPTQDVLAIRRKNGGLVAEMMHWWYIPPWAKEPHKITAFNSRDDKIFDTETHKKSMMRSPFQKRRCLIVAGGFYEWLKVDKEKIPHYFHLKDRNVFGFAGLWGDWDSPDGETVRTCSIVTTSPNELVKPIHDRMPAIIKRDDEMAYLDPEQNDLEELRQYVQPYPVDEMDVYKVSKVVSNSRNEVPECIEPIA